MQMLKRFMKRHNKDEGLQQELNGCLLGPHEQRTLSSKAENEPKENCEIIFLVVHTKMSWRSLPILQYSR